MSLVDNLIILLFFLLIIIFSIYQKKNLTNNIESYFLAGKDIHWVIAMLSIVATETSVLTFVGIPAISYTAGNWNFLQVVFGYILGRILVSYFLLPMYFKEGIVSIYQVIGKRFGKSIQKMASLTFLITRLFADGVRFLATASIVSIITGWGLDVSILVIGIITIFYSSIGGFKTILWVDGFQFFIYLSCGVLAVIHIYGSELFNYQNIYQNGFFDIINYSTNSLSSKGLIMSMLAGILMSFGSHGIDYLMVQRVLSTNNLTNAKKAMIGSGFFVFIQFSIFLCVGTFLLSGTFFDSTVASSEIFTVYIRDYIPSGLRGIMLAGALSAAMSSLSSSINSLASSTIIDILGKSFNMKKSIITSILWGILLTVFSLIFDYNPESSVVILCLKIVSFTYGGLISLFIFARLKMPFSKESIMIGYISSIVILLILAYYYIPWEYYISISILSNFIITYFVNFSIKSIKRVKY